MAKKTISDNAKKESLEKPTCGIVMPISEIDGCSSSHWQDVRGIIAEAAEIAGYEAKLVSESDDIGVIQTRIVQNLYDHEIVVCDVSAKNANVMFELGLRLAFDKPAIVLKDDKTSYSFDTSPIEHLEYPRDLRYTTIEDFKKKLASKIKATVEAAKKSDYKSFLKHFGKFEVSGLQTEEISSQEYLLKEIKLLQHDISRMSSDLRRTNSIRNLSNISRELSPNSASMVRKAISELLQSGEFSHKDLAPGNQEIYAALFKHNGIDFEKFSTPKKFEESVDEVLLRYFL